ncbi:serpin family protein [Amphibacillus sp. Q70]|uniref:serpin family protein n=1 Tax=Amphibacillus sp. Q70 TaxID=3453416 RepID=UPI003F851C29
MKKFIASTIVILLLTACGTTDDDSSDSGTENDANFNESDYQKIISANNGLGFDLLKVVDSDENGNIFISPTSLSMALSMAYNGADGETKQEIADTLQIEEPEVDELNQANASLISMIIDDSEQVQLDIGNSIWLNNEFHFQDDFAENNTNYFNAEIQEIDINDTTSADQINDWVKEATNDKIDEITDAPLDPDMVAMLINTIYFHGSWTHPFDEDETEEQTFHLDDGSTKDVPLMKLNENLMYMENDDFQAVSLPYGDDEEMSMDIFLPKENSTLKDFQEKLTNQDWEEWKAEFQQQEGTVMLPKFQLEYEATLNETLETLGMTTAFDEEKANFEKMIEEDDPLWITEVKQKTFIDVNEEGTEAAGSTSVEIGTTSAPIDEPFEMKVNRPFFIAITDNETEAILFMGTIFSP